MYWLRALFITNRDLHRHITRLDKKVDQFMSLFTDLKEAVTAQTTAINDLKTRVAEDVDTLKEQLAEALADKPELVELLDSIKSNTASLNTVDPIVDEVVESPETSDTVPLQPEGEPVDDTAPVQEELPFTEGENNN